VSKFSKTARPWKASTKRRRKTSTTRKWKKKSSLQKTTKQKRKKPASVKKSTEKRKKKISLKQVTIGKPLVDEHFGRGKSVEVWIKNRSVYNAMLNLRNHETNMDKFYILQVLKSPKGFTFCTRWGRTGTTGQLKSIGPNKDHQVAVKQFEAKFKEKTGVAWGAKEALLGKTNPNSKKYSILHINYAPQERNVMWQYFVDDGVDGKSVGWYDYSKSGSAEVEKVWQQHQANTSANLGIRHVKSGYFTYEVDFRKMQQTNVSHHARKRRLIRRFTK